MRPAEKIHLIGPAGGGRWAVFAAVLAGDAVDRVAIDTAGFKFADLNDIRHPDLLPGAIKYGDLPSVLSLIPAERMKSASAGQGEKELADWVTREVSPK